MMTSYAEMFLLLRVKLFFIYVLVRTWNPALREHYICYSHLANVVKTISYLNDYFELNDYLVFSDYIVFFSYLTISYIVFWMKWKCFIWICKIILCEDDQRDSGKQKKSRFAILESDPKAMTTKKILLLTHLRQVLLGAIWSTFILFYRAYFLFSSFEKLLSSLSFR